MLIWLSSIVKCPFKWGVLSLLRLITLFIIKGNYPCKSISKLSMQSLKGFPLSIPKACNAATPWEGILLILSTFFARVLCCGSLLNVGISIHSAIYQFRCGKSIYRGHGENYWTVTLSSIITLFKMHVALISILKVHDPTPSRDACSEALWFQSAGQIWPILYVQI